jgi:hypothetical protein
MSTKTTFHSFYLHKCKKSSNFARYYAVEHYKDYTFRYATKK